MVVVYEEEKSTDQTTMTKEISQTETTGLLSLANQGPFAAKQEVDDTIELVNQSVTSSIPSIDPSVNHEVDSESPLDPETNQGAVSFETDVIETTSLIDETETVLQDEKSPLEGTTENEQPLSSLDEEIALEEDEETSEEASLEEDEMLDEETSEETALEEDEEKKKFPILSSIGKGLGTIVKDLGQNAGALVKQAVTNVGTTVKHVVQNTVNTVSNLVENVVNVVVQPIKNVVQVAKDVKEAKIQAELTNTAPPKAGEVTRDILRGVVGGLLGGVGHLVTETVNDVGTLTTDLVNDAVYLVTDTVIDTTKLTVDLVKDTVGLVTGVTETVTEQLKKPNKDQTVPPVIHPEEETSEPSVVKPTVPSIVRPEMPKQDSNGSHNTYPIKDSTQTQNNRPDNSVVHVEMPIIQEPQEFEENNRSSMEVEEPVVVERFIEPIMPEIETSESEDITMQKSNLKEMITDAVNKEAQLVAFDGNKYSLSNETANEQRNPMTVTKYSSSVPSGESQQMGNGQSGNSGTAQGLVSAFDYFNLLFEGQIMKTQVEDLKEQWTKDPLGKPPQALLFYYVA